MLFYERWRRYAWLWIEYTDFMLIIYLADVESSFGSIGSDNSMDSYW
jgi:hypothetical protein